MPSCEVCGNEHDKVFEIVLAGRRHVFDTFECALHALSAVCEHCRKRTVAQGIEASARVYCSVQCAQASTATA
jgi:hypothetical protein